MISVNQGIRTSAPEKVENRGTNDVSHQGGDFFLGGEGGGGKNIKGGLKSWRAP